MKIRGLVTSVGYAPTLAITLIRNMRHLAQCYIVTSPDDHATQAVARSVPGARLHITDAFTRPGIDSTVPRFNKGLAVEEALDAMNREGWILIHDADVLFPDWLQWELTEPGNLYGAYRRILHDVDTWRPALDWTLCERAQDGGPVGFFQLFHADDPHIAGRRPWYDVSFCHAGGGDAYFLEHWPSTRRKLLPIDVLHLGKPNHSWFGTDAVGRDMMAAYVHTNKWPRAMQQHDPAAVARVGPIADRLRVAGYPPSPFELPFVRPKKHTPPP